MLIALSGTLTCKMRHKEIDIRPFLCQDIPPVSGVRRQKTPIAKRSHIHGHQVILPSDGSIAVLFIVSIVIPSINVVIFGAAICPHYLSFLFFLCVFPMGLFFCFHSLRVDN